MSSWNNNFTTLLRASNPAFWGNWALNMNIQPGAIGLIDGPSGDFTALGSVIPGAIVNNNPYTSSWDIRSDDVTEKQTNVEFDGTVIDPETGAKITAGINMAWGFKSEGSLVSKFAVTRQSSLNDFTNLIASQMVWLKQQAGSANMLTSDGIVQGFCVVTDVIYANSGINVGANTNQGSFSISGSASGVDAMLGISGSGKGSYVSTNSETSTDSHTWPSTPSTLADADIPIAFAVASFQGDIVITKWTHLISSYELILDNSHGGTYIAHGELTYNVGDNKVTTSNKASGGMTSAIRDIPINASNLIYTVTFTASSTKKVFNWGSPLNQWQSGMRHIDVKGVWPGSPSAVDREAS